MGLFDEVSVEWRPALDAVHASDSSMRDFQTKALACTMSWYKIDSDGHLCSLVPLAGALTESVGVWMPMWVSGYMWLTPMSHGDLVIKFADGVAQEALYCAQDDVLEQTNMHTPGQALYYDPATALHGPDNLCVCPPCAGCGRQQPRTTEDRRVCSVCNNHIVPLYPQWTAACTEKAIRLFLDHNPAYKMEVDHYK